MFLFFKKLRRVIKTLFYIILIVRMIKERSTNTKIKQISIIHFKFSKITTLKFFSQSVVPYPITPTISNTFSMTIRYICVHFSYKTEFSAS